MKSAPYSFAVILFIGVVIGCAFMLFIYSNFILPDKDAHIELLQEQKAKLEKEKQPNGVGVTNIKTVTRQEIRTFLESISPKILQAIDAGQERVYVLISIPEQVELTNLSKQPDFSSFLSFEQSGNVDIHSGGNRAGHRDGYYFYPKDALTK